MANQSIESAYGRFEGITLLTPLLESARGFIESHDPPLAPASEMAYLSDIRGFLAYMETGPKPFSINPETVREYFEGIGVEGLFERSTRLRKATVIGEYLRYLRRKNYIEDEMKDLVGGYRLRDARLVPGPKSLTAGQISELLSLARSVPRDLAILHLQLAGLGVTVVKDLDFDNVLVKGDQVEVEGTSNGDFFKRILVDDSAEALKAYLKDPNTLRRKWWSSRQENPDLKALFSHHFLGERLTRQGIWLIVKKYGEQIAMDIKPSKLISTYYHHFRGREPVYFSTSLYIPEFRR